MAIIQLRYRETRGRGNLLQSPNKFTYCRNLTFFPRTCQTIQNKFPNMKFHDFPGPGPKFHDFPGLESKLSNSMTFQDWYEPCFIQRRIQAIGLFKVLYTSAPDTPGAKTIKKNTNSTQNKSETHHAKQYEVTSFLSTNCELSTETCSKNVYSLGPCSFRYQLDFSRKHSNHTSKW